MYFKPLKSWYTKYWQWSSLKGWFERIIWCRSVSISSYITYTSLNESGAVDVALERCFFVNASLASFSPADVFKSTRQWPPVGATTSAMRITFSCFKCRNSLISRSVRLASTAFSNAFVIFLIATRASERTSRALHTTPYAPLPMGLMGA